VIEKGRPWGHPARTEAALVVEGDDADLAAALDRASGELVRFVPAPASDLGRALGLTNTGPGATEVALDVLAVATPAASHGAVNAVVLGRAPHRLRAWHRRVRMVVEVDGRQRFAGRAAGVVIANGQYLHGLDVVPRGHPGDGRIEAQVYAPSAAERAEMRRRLPQGTHVPHPGITQVTGRRVTVRAGRNLALEIDGRPAGTAREVTVEVLPAALRLLI
jgi:diacylglycerol kinase family enzyme